MMGICQQRLALAVYDFQCVLDCWTCLEELPRLVWLLFIFITALRMELFALMRPNHYYVSDHVVLVKLGR